MTDLRYYYVADDVTSVLDSQPGLNYNNDLSTVFSAIFNNPGAFTLLINKIKATLNGDRRFKLLKKLGKLPADPATGTPFEQYFYDKSIIELIRAFDGLLSHSPYA